MRSSGSHMLKEVTCVHGGHIHSKKSHALKRGSHMLKGVTCAVSAHMSSWCL